MIRRILLSIALLLSGLPTWADGISDATVYGPITVASADVAESIPIFPVFLSDMKPEFWDALAAASDTTGATIRFTESTGATELPFYIVSINTGTESGCILVRGDPSASVDTVLRIYAGSPTASAYSVTDTYGRNAVFTGSGYVGYYLPGMTLVDLTGAGRDLTAVGSPGTTASAWEGITAATYNGSSQYHYYAGTQAVTDWPLTIVALAYANNVTDIMGIVGLHDHTGTGSQVALQFQGTAASDPIRGYAAGANSTYSIAAKIGYVASANYHVGMTRDDNTGTLNVYLDGGSPSTDSTSLNAPSFTRLGIGRAFYNNDQAGQQNYLNGRVAQAAISNSVRSANFIATEHAAWQPSFYSVGAAVELGGSCESGSTGWVLFQTVGQSTTSDMDWSNTSDALVDDANTADIVLDDITDQFSEYLNFTNPAYGTTIPEGANSYTVTLRIKRRADTNAGKRIYDETVKFIDDTGTRVGDNLASGTFWSSSDTTLEYPVTGVSFDGSEFTSAAGMSLRLDGSSTNGATTAEVYVAWIKIDWVCDATDADRARGFFVLAE